MAGPVRKYEKLMESMAIRRWYDEMSMFSRITAYNYLRRLSSFCNSVKKDLHAFLLLDDKGITELISDEITAMEKRGLAGRYNSSTVKAVKSWLTHNDRKLSRKIRIKDLDGAPTLKDERTPTLEELKRIFASGGPGARVSCVLTAQSGMRPEVIGNYLGNDGLKLSDIQDLEIEDGIVNFRRSLSMIAIRPELSKARH